jgi:hypothetical protein
MLRARFVGSERGMCEIISGQQEHKADHALLQQRFSVTIKVH